MFLVTGGGSGIGRALAHALAMRDKKVLIIGRREPALIETAAFSPLISYLCSDVSTPEGREQIVNHLARFNCIEGLVHNAGVIEPIAPVATIDESSWQQVIETNLNAPLFLSQMLLGKLQQGRVLHMGSGVAYFPVKGWAGYCVSKAALSMLTRCWQLESENVAFASVMPGIINTDMQEIIRKAQGMDEKKLNFFKVLYKEGRLLSTDTVALFLCWLLLDLDKDTYVSKEWDIYDKSHHPHWLVEPHQVPDWE
mgnify:CR=1 FL=1